MKAFGEFELAESKLVESLWSVSVSVELFLRPVARLRRPDTEEDIVPLDCTEGVRTKSLRRGAGRACQNLRIESKKLHPLSGGRGRLGPAVGTTGFS